MKDHGPATEALLLRRFDYSENSQIARLFTRSHGRISVIAKGSKKPNPDIRGPLDLFCHAEVAFRPRKPEELAVLTRYRVVTGHPGLRQSIERLAAAFYLVELLCEGTRDGDPDPGLFDLFAAALAALETAATGDLDATILATELGYLRDAGFQPSLEQCVACGTVAPAARLTAYSPGRGGIVCSRCMPADTPGLLRLTAGQRRTLLALGATEPARARRVAVLPRDRMVLRQILDRTIEHVLEKELQSAAFLVRSWD